MKNSTRVHTLLEPRNHTGIRRIYRIQLKRDLFEPAKMEYATLWAICLQSQLKIFIYVEWLGARVLDFAHFENN